MYSETETDPALLPELPRIDLTRRDVYSPADRELSGTFGGNTYRVQPGVTIFTSDEELAKDERGRVRKGFCWVRGIHGPKKPRITVLDVLLHLLGDDGRRGPLGDCGVRGLFGDGRDEAIKAEADRRWREVKYRDCYARQQAHYDRVRKQKEAGLPPTPPDRETIQAMEYVAKAHSEDGMTARWMCSTCNMRATSAEGLDAHRRGLHPEEFPDGALPPPEELPVRPAGKGIDETGPAAQAEAARVIVAGQSVPRKPAPIRT